MMKKSLVSLASESNRLLKSQTENPVMKESDIKKYGRDCLAPISSFRPDELNTELRGGHFNVDELALSMKEKGFFGRITAYKSEEDPNIYIIESGERRYRAALKAGLTEIPFTLVEPPKNTFERRLNLTKANFLDDNKSPLSLANQINFHFQTLTEENERRKKNLAEMKAKGEPLPSDPSLLPFPVIEQVAKDMGISKSSVDKLKRLTKLIPELQELANKNGANWSVLSTASSLDKKSQEILFKRIQGEMRIYGENAELPPTAWIKNEIKEMLAMKTDPVYEKFLLEKGDSQHSYKYDPNDTSFFSDELKNKLFPEKTKVRDRKKDGIKAISKAYFLLQSALDKDKSIIYERDSEKKKKFLEELKELIDQELEKIE